MVNSLHIIPLTVSDFQQNCRLLIDPASQEGVIIDPGGDADLILKECEKHQVQWKAIWLSHSHIDHCGAVLPIKNKLNIPLFAHPNEEFFRKRVKLSAQFYGLNSEEYDDCPEPEKELFGDETLYLGNLSFKVLYTPGHSPGHLCFFQPENKILIAGDTLFNGSIGRTDLPQGDHQQLLTSISERILTLPEETKVLPGHGSDTTVGKEKLTNPFLQD